MTNKDGNYCGIVSFRAECSQDVEGLLERAAMVYPMQVSEVRVEDCQLKGNIPIPDKDVEMIVSGDLTIARLHAVMLAVPDGHVMAETLRAVPLSENSLERRYFDSVPEQWGADPAPPKDSVAGFNYQLLGRLQQDCDYYLGNGGRAKKHLWAGDEAGQIKKMKELYEELPEKPEWLTLAAIERYEAAMIGRGINREEDAMSHKDIGEPPRDDSSSCEM